VQGSTKRQLKEGRKLHRVSVPESPLISSTMGDQRVYSLLLVIFIPWMDGLASISRLEPGCEAAQGSGETSHLCLEWEVDSGAGATVLSGNC
jgi:hypothetical protein